MPAFNLRSNSGFGDHPDPHRMIPEPHSILSSAVRMLMRCGSGLLITKSATGPPRMWIGTPVRTIDGHLLFSQLDPNCELLTLAAANPRATWRFHDVDGRLVFFWEGTLSVLPRTLVVRSPAAAGRFDHGMASLVTNVASITQVVPEEKMVCRVVLPPGGSAATSRQPALAF